MIAADGAVWFACHHAERPPDAYVRWHYGHCSPCSIKARALADQYPADTHVDWLVGMTEPRP